MPAERASAIGRASALPTARKAGCLAGILADWDLLLLLALILADVRVFQGSSVASFTLFELFAWGYCTPVVIGHMLGARSRLPPAYQWFAAPLGCYLAWLLVAALFALFARQHSDVLQQAKNVMPALPVTGFVLTRLRRPQTVARLANLYILYCIVDSGLALLQLHGGGPYLRPPIENNEYKLDYTGDLVSNVVLGFSGTPNELAVAVLPGIMFSAIALVHELRAWQRPRLLTLSCCALTSIAFLLAQSRGAVIWFVFGLAWMISPLRRSRSFALKVGLAAVLVVALVAYEIQVPTAVADVENTVEARYLLWLTSLQAMVDDPYVMLLGDGSDYVLAWSWRIAGWQFPDAHNGWIDQALFFGLPALLFYLAIWRRFFTITDTPVAPGPAAARTQVLLDGIRGSVLSYMGLYFFEPVAHAVFPVSQIFLLMSCGVVLRARPS